MEDYLKKYIEKRNFEKTPEPGGLADGAARDYEHANNIFVVHRHDARNLHFDLRIAYDNRLVCWAVPKGFSYDPAAKHLAVHTEDHPFSYIGFEGIIPKGEYGAGSMNIWDSGNYELVKETDLALALESGEVKLKLYGRKLRGEWHLVMLKNRSPAATPGEGQGKEWLLLKGKDKYRDKKWDRLLGMDLSFQPEAALPTALDPMRFGAEASSPFNGHEWAFEPEIPGLRAFCMKAGNEISFTSGKDPLPESAYLAGRFGSLREIAFERAVIDGVIVAMEGDKPGETKISSRENLDALLREKSPGAILCYFVFDLVFFEDYDLTCLPYDRRKALLQLALTGNDRVFFVDYVREQGIVFASQAKAAGFSSMIAKTLDSPYEAGKSGNWKKIDLKGVGETAQGVPGGPSGVSQGKTLFKISHPDKIFFPRQNLTKKDLIDYYDGVCEYLLPFLKDRPLHLYRFPDGVGGSSFYQKHLPDKIPPYLETITVQASASGGENPAETGYVICNNRESLLYLVNLGSIDLHPWFSRKQHLLNPDWIAWDLDPKKAAFAHVIRLAKEIGKIIRGIGMKPFLKTSGKSGLHIFVSVKPEYTYDQTRMFSESIARIVANENRKIATVERNVDKREDKVYIDFLQNRKGQTLAPPYAVRPVDAASVSMPLDWDELNNDLDVTSFIMTNARQRISEKGELFRDLLLRKEDLAPAVEKLEQFYRGA